MRPITVALLRPSFCLALVATACGHTHNTKTLEIVEKPFQVNPSLIYRDMAREALHSVGIDREPAHALLLPMAINRLLVTWNPGDFAILDRVIGSPQEGGGANQTKR